MKPISPKRRLRNQEARPVREQLKEDIGRCEYCGRRHAGIVVHEVLRGSMRSASLDKPFAVLVLCDACHALMDGRDWAEQLAILRRSRPQDFNLLAFHSLARRCKPTDSEVALWSLRLSFVPADRSERYGS